MALEGTLKNRDGKLYVLYTFDEDSEPVRQYIWYRVLGTRGTGYGGHPEAGDLATRDSAGDWRARNPATHPVDRIRIDGYRLNLGRTSRARRHPPTSDRGESASLVPRAMGKTSREGLGPSWRGQDKGREDDFCTHKELEDDFCTRDPKTRHSRQQPR